ncbi:hypothetical protein L4D08_25250 [Photobacterium chitinilyticum]|uniref:hypothetical protein n=1 Tax=Photobacterium chitinilyticum TaxID=2485123 RepID=UPI003D11B447
MRNNKKENIQVTGDSVSIIHHNKAEEPTKRKWVVPVVTTLIGIIATIIVAWYQLNVSEEQAQQAALERERSVKSNIVKIVEEHVINDNTLDVARLARLIDLRSREERLNRKISVLEVLQKAEFNIINSSYLEFKKKDKYKQTFDKIYATISFGGLDNYSGKHENVANELAKAIRSGDNEVAITALGSLLDLFNKDIEDAESKSGNLIISISKLLEPRFFLIIIGVQAVLMFLLSLIRFQQRKRREQDLINRHKFKEYVNSRFQEEDF